MKSVVAIFVLVSVGVVVAACGDNQTHPDRATYDAGAQQPLSCVPNLDGKIDRNELGAAIGVPARYLVSPNGVARTINQAGSVDAAGHKTWDWSNDYADDQAATIVASAPAGKWYEAKFPFSKFSVGGDEVAWTSIGTTKNQMLRGLPFAGKDTYEVTVDAEGQIALPDVTFTQSIRLRTKLTIEPTVGATTTQFQTSYFFECFGEVARATSKLNETNPDFSSALEIRRLGLPNR